MEDILIQDIDSNIYYWIDAILFLVFTITVSYLLLFALASLFKKRVEYPAAKEKSKIAVVYLVFDADWDVMECLSYLTQDYPSDKYKIFVVGADITQSMQKTLLDMNIGCLVCENSQSNVALLSKFVSELDNKDSFEYVAIHNIHDKVDSNFLSKVNDAIYSGCDVVQTHCKTVDDKSIWNVYKSISEEINNTIFREAHCRISLSSALSDTGIVMSMKILKICLQKQTNVGMAKHFEKIILKNNYYIEYLEFVYTYTEKGSGRNMGHNKQQKRYRHHLINMIKTLFYIPFAIIQGNIDYINKLFQWILPPRVLLIVLICIFGFFALYIDIFASLKWWALLTLLIVTFFIAIPSSLITGRLVKILLFAPIYILYVIIRKVFRFVKR